MAREEMVLGVFISIFNAVDGLVVYRLFAWWCFVWVCGELDFTRRSGEFSAVSSPVSTDNSMSSRSLISIELRANMASISNRSLAMAAA